jgi:phosphoribosylformylglycinamidine synthase
VLGETGDELGGSEYYDLFGQLGLNVPRLKGDNEKRHYTALQRAIDAGLVNAAHGIYRGGLGIHLTLMALAGDLGLEMDLARVPVASPLRTDKVLFSESCGRVILCVDPKKKKAFEKTMSECRMAYVGRVRKDQNFMIKNEGQTLIKSKLRPLREAFHQTFGGLI